MLENNFEELNGEKEQKVYNFLETLWVQEYEDER